MKINILTIGTRGDVQPYLGLGAGLAARGHDVAVQTLAEFKDVVEDTGLEHRPLRGNFIAVARARGVEAPPSLKMMGEYRRMAAETLEDEWAGAKDSDLLVFNPAAWGGPHIAEKLDIPAFAAFPTPMYTPTRMFPSPFIPGGSLGPFNKVSHSFVIKSGPAAFRKPISHWRRNVLDLPKRGGRTFPMLYAFSEHVVPLPLTGPRMSLSRLLVPRQRSELAPAALARRVHRRRLPARVHRFREHVHSPCRGDHEDRAQTVGRTGQRAVISTGWGGLRPENPPDDVHVVDGVPHDWLFPRMAAVVHHGGAGTTAAGLRTGKPSVICPFITDQFFWGRRVHDLGAGPEPVPQKKLSAERLAAAIDCAVNDEAVAEASRGLGDRIAREDGVAVAADYILDRG
jgi:UDP:flavonoid glycosyltransferase YjiC (YdhE family)